MKSECAVTVIKQQAMDQMQKSQYQKACIVICGDVMEDWRYIFRELKMRVRVSVESKSSLRSLPGREELVVLVLKGRYS